MAPRARDSFVPTIVLRTDIRAPIERCFDLARSIDLHADSQGSHEERAVAGRTSGLIGPGEEVTWEAKHLLVRQRLTSRIVSFDRPRAFRDSMVRGAFARFDHDHEFEERDGATVMTDRFDYTSPLGPLGRVADVLFLRRYMERFLAAKAYHLKVAAESPGWERWLSSAGGAS